GSQASSNLRPLGYEPNELPTAPPRDVSLRWIQPPNRAPKVGPTILITKLITRYRNPGARPACRLHVGSTSRRRLGSQASSNLRPLASGYEPNELPTAPPRDVTYWRIHLSTPVT